ncbi:MAG TPA: ribonuclease HI [Terriglobales bacterium]|nr:ribonuclease HI [Terriglobales bacterium]
MKKIKIYTDGGCRGNPGVGGWAAVLEYGDHTREISGGEAHTTNNRMELMAAIEALRTVHEPCEIDFYTDSQYLRLGITEWLAKWKRNGWQTSTRTPVKNSDLWQRLDAEARRHTLSWHWVRGHAGHAINERCDALANLEMDKLRRQP